MEPLHALYLILFAFSTIYLALLKPSVDGFSVALGGVVFYFLPALLGQGRGVFGPYTIDPAVYLFSCLLILALVVGDRIIPRVRIDLQTEESPSGQVQTRILTVLTMLLVIVMIFQVDFSAVGAAKTDISPPATASVLRYLIPISFIAAWLYRDWKFLIPIGASLVFFTVFFQVRSPAAITLIGTFLYELHTRDSSVPNRVQVGTVAVLGGLSIVFFDKVKGRLLSGEYGLLFELNRAANQVVWNNNGHIIFEILNRTVSQGYRLSDPEAHTGLNFLNVLPFSETLFGIPSAKFSVLIQPVLFPGIDFGVGSNIWAEAFAIGGAMGLALGLLVFLVGLAVLSAQLDSESWSIRLFAFSMMPYWAFFNHRLTFGAILNTITISALMCFGPRVILAVSRRFSQASKISE